MILYLVFLLGDEAGTIVRFLPSFCQIGALQQVILCHGKKSLICVWMLHVAIGLVCDEDATISNQFV